MSVRTFTGYTPSPRADQPWTHLEIRESVDGGPYLAIENIALDPVDSDPLRPAERSITTTNAAAAGSYQVVFIDDDSNEEIVDTISYPSTDAAARAKLERMVAMTDQPILSDADISDLLDAARRPDASGLVWSDDDWTPTWDLDAAAAAGWEIKAGRAAHLFDFGEDSQRFNASDISAQCLAMAKLYRRGSGSVRAGSVQVGDYLNAKAASTPIGPPTP